MDYNSRVTRRMLAKLLGALLVSHVSGYAFMTTPDMVDCPDGQIYCLKRDRCVMLDGSCPDPLQCGQNEIVSRNEYGYEQCIPDVTVCGANEHQCIDGQTSYCSSDPACRNDYLGNTECSEGQIYCMASRQCVNEDGSCVATCQPYECHNSTWPYCSKSTCGYEGNMFCSMGEHECYNGKTRYCSPDPECTNVDYGNMECPEGQIYCLEQRMCVPVNGSCSGNSTSQCLLHEHTCYNSMGPYCSTRPCNESENFKCATGEHTCYNSMGPYCSTRPCNESENFKCATGEFVCQSKNGTFCTDKPCENLNITGCAVGQIYCLEQRMCVPVNGSCSGNSTSQCLLHEHTCYNSIGPYCSTRPCNESENFKCATGEFVCQSKNGTFCTDKPCENLNITGCAVGQFKCQARNGLVCSDKPCENLNTTGCIEGQFKCQDGNMTFCSDKPCEHINTTSCPKGLFICQGRYGTFCTDKPCENLNITGCTVGQFICQGRNGTFCTDKPCENFNITGCTVGQFKCQSRNGTVCSDKQCENLNTTGCIQGQFICQGRNGTFCTDKPCENFNITGCTVGQLKCQAINGTVCSDKPCENLNTTGCIVGQFICQGRNGTFCTDKPCENFSITGCTVGQYECSTADGIKVCSDAPCEGGNENCPEGQMLCGTEADSIPYCADKCVVMSVAGRIVIAFPLQGKSVTKEMFLSTNVSRIRDLESDIANHVAKQLSTANKLDFSPESVAIVPSNADGDIMIAFVEGRGLIDPESIEALRRFLTTPLTDTDGGTLEILGNVSVVVVPDNEQTAKVVELSDTVKSNTEYSFTLSEILPKDMVEAPANIVVDCSAVKQVQLKQGDGSFGPVLKGTLTSKITIKHAFKVTTLTRCLMFDPDSKTQDEGNIYKIGFIALGAALDTGAMVKLFKNTVVLQEDAPCTAFPDLFSISYPFVDEVISAFVHWHKEQLQNNEELIGHTNIGQIAQTIIIGAMRSALESVRLRLVDVSITPESNLQSDKTLKAKLMSGNGITDVSLRGTSLLSKSDSVKICPASEFSGTFSLEISGSQKFYINVTVLPTNDKPVKQPVDLVNGVEPMSYPHTSMVANTSAPDVPIFSIQKIADVLFSDHDPGTKLGLAVFGYVSSNEIGGVWDVRRTSTSSWQTLQAVTISTTGAAEAKAVLLSGQDSLRFTPSEKSVAITWSARNAPKVVLAGWDMSDKDKVDNLDANHINITQCDRVGGSSMASFCTLPSESAYSKSIIVLPLTRRGCDGVLNSEKVMGVCGCGVHTGCEDCRGVPKGGHILDVCGQCIEKANALSKIDCSNSVCAKANSFCARVTALQNSLDSECGAGFNINSYFNPQSAKCSSKCIAVTDDPKVTQVDKCGVMCGDDNCLDCAGTPNGTKVTNACGECKEIGAAREGCESIGNIEPKVVFAKSRADITVDVSGLAADPAAVCRLTNKTPYQNAVPVVLKRDNVMQAGALTRIKLVINATGSVGEFAVECSTLTSADQDQYLTVYTHPQLTSISPAVQTITDVDEVTITGTGFVNTSGVVCLVPCSELNAGCKHYKSAEGTYVNKTTVTCPANYLVGENRMGMAYHISVMLENPDAYNMQSLTSSVAFTVRMPAPKVVNATLDKNGCYKIQVVFDEPISKANDTQCMNYFTAATISTHFMSVGKCLAIHRMLIIETNTNIAAGGVLVFKPNTITHEAERNTANVNYVTGQVTVLAHPDEVKPVVHISKRVPRVVGCTQINIGVTVEHVGCHKPAITWTITADSSTQEASASVATLTTQSKKDIFIVDGNMLLTNVVYNVTMKWEAGSHSGSDSIDIRRDTNFDAVLNIYGVPSSGTVDVNEKLGLKAEFKTCLTVVDIEYLWELSPIYNIPQARQTRSTYIPAGSLAYGTAYNLTCTVTYAGKEISATVGFTTKAEPIYPAFVISGTPLSSSLAEMRFIDDLEVACVNGKKPTDISGLLCTWTCENNVFSPTTFSPCFELVDDKVQPLKREGQSVVISGASRIDPQKWDLRERWTLTMRQLSSKEMTVTKEFLFKKVPLELKAPHLTTKINKLSVTRTDTSLDIKARCRQLTSYHWNPPSVNGDIGLPILNFTMVVRGDVKKEVEYTGDTFIPCGVEIDLTSTELVANTTYSLVIEVYNSRDDIRLSAREEFEIFVIPEPIAGSISLSYAGSKLTALTTPITIALVNWWDAVDDLGLECWYYFFEDGTSGDKVTNINTLSNPLTQGISNITLPEGKHKIGAKCCNRFGMCVKQVYDTALTVAPIDASGLLSAVQDVLEQVRKGGTDSILNTILGLLKATKEVGLTGEQAAETQTTIGDTSNMVIGDLLDSTDGDVESSLNVLESTSEIVKANPSGISEETKATIMSASTEVSKERIGIEDGNQQRRKRSTECRTYSNPAGLQESEAITLLKAFDATINEVSITSIQASLYLETIENIMIGFCQAFSGSSAWVVPAEKVYVREHTMALGGKGRMQLPVSCDSCESVTHPTHPALVSYGAHLEAYFNDTWACTSDTTCDDVCVASAQLKVDTVTPTAATEVIAPPRRSDLVVLKMINPETYCEQAFPALTDPLQVELTLTGTIDTEKYYYQCLMWVNENWSGSKCTSSGVVLDQSSSRNTTTCSCTTLGIIGVFEVSKDATTTTVATTTVATTTAAPSKTLMANTDAVEYTFTLNVDYDTHVINVATFKTSMKTQIASKTGVPEACITNLELAKGSIIISFDLVVSAGSGTLGQLAYAVESVFTSGGSVTFNSPSGLTLTVESGSFKIVQKNMDTGSGQDNKKETSDKNNLPMIIGASLGGLAIVGVVVVLVVYIVKFKVTKRTHPITPVSAAKFPDEPPPAYGPTPPPPFMYEPPPHAHMTNKWVENELQQMAQGERAPSNASNKSGGSFEKKRLLQKSRDTQQTPIG